MTYPDGTNARLIEVAAAEVGTIEEGDNLTSTANLLRQTDCPGAVLSSIGVQPRQASRFIQLLALPLVRINLRK